MDTPGFGDSDHEDEELITEMMRVLANTLDHADTIVLVLKGTETRFTEGLQTMIKRMTLMFGQAWWDYLIFGVSFWPYDQESIDARECFPDFPQYCKDEAWFAREMNLQAQEKFGITQNFTFVFTDSWSQTAGPPGFNTEDPLQQQHWQKETGILWNITTTREEPFSFMTIDDILEENARQRAEIKWLNNVITNNISDLAASISRASEDIYTLKAVTIPHMEEKSDAGDAALQTFVEIEVGRVEDKMSAMNLAPVGTVTAWLGGNTLPLPAGWQKCDGSTILAGPMEGQSTPDLNGEKLFLRGGSSE